jgi:hypothetical protein
MHEKSFAVSLKKPFGESGRLSYRFMINAPDLQTAEEWVWKVFGLKMQKKGQSKKTSTGDVKIADCKMAKNGEEASGFSTWDFYKELQRVYMYVVEELQRSVYRKGFWESQKSYFESQKKSDDTNEYTELCDFMILKQEKNIERAIIWSRNLLNELVMVHNEAVRCLTGCTTSHTVQGGE